MEARRLENLLVSVGLLDEDDLSLPVEALLASWAEISMFDNKLSSKDFYHAARKAGCVVSRAWLSPAPLASTCGYHVFGHVDNGVLCSLKGVGGLGEGEAG